MVSRNIYLIGSLRNAEIPVLASLLRDLGHNVFDDWYSAGPEADDYWRDYEQARGHNLPEALNGYAARHVFEFDKHHLDRCDTAILALPAGRSGHLELGYSAGLGHDCAILMESDPERYDLMYRFANLGVFFKIEDLINELGKSPSLGSNSNLRDNGTGLPQSEGFSS